MTKTVLPFAAWTIAPNEAPDAEPITHAIQCAACGEQSLAFEEIGPAQLWALKHAGRHQDHHTYREIATRSWRATGDGLDPAVATDRR